MKKKEVLVNLGCGTQLLPGFINIDNSFTMADLKGKKGFFKQSKMPKGAEFLKGDMRKIPLKDNSVDYIECLEAIEHLPFAEVHVALLEMLRVLKPGGKLVLFTTDFDDIAKTWTDHIAGKPFNPTNWHTMDCVIYGHQATEGEYHRSLFNPTYLDGLVREMGFDNVKTVSYPRYSYPPKWRGAKWPKKVLQCGAVYTEGFKPLK